VEDNWRFRIGSHDINLYYDFVKLFLEVVVAKGIGRSLHYFWLLVLPHYIFLKCYNFLLFKIFLTKGVDINTLQTQGSV
jgi:hypothetical protein